MTFSTSPLTLLARLSFSHITVSCAAMLGGVEFDGFHGKQNGNEQNGCTVGTRKHSRASQLLRPSDGPIVQGA
uniref:Putative secreted protein n=1 Tax=Anopheles darlingi TaxID=43151 RepID=A0A2M4DIP4_ANODA